MTGILYIHVFDHSRPYDSKRIRACVGGGSDIPLSYLMTCGSYLSVECKSVITELVHVQV